MVATCWRALALTILLAGCGQEASEAVEGVGRQVEFRRQAAVDVTLALLRRHLSAFQMAHGRFPRDLEELAGDQGLPLVPAPPDGLRWTYDPATGQIAAEGPG